MNNLNSVLVEGTVSGEAEFTERKDFNLCRLAVVSKRYYGDGKLFRTVSFAVEAYDELAVACRDKAKINAPVRIVGRMENEDSGNIYILAEHIEFLKN